MNTPIHIYPLDDLFPHQIEGEDCPCQPVIRHTKRGVKLIIHNAFDRREYYENWENKMTTVVQ